MKTIQNPILRGFCPDPCMIRTGDDYYIATSTFEWWPCVNLYHSKDLAHWEQLPSPLREPGQMDLRGDPNSGGIWAPDLSWDGQYYYLLVTNVTTKKGRWYNTHNYMSRAASITGPWSQPVYLNSIGFDPSLLHDTDGKCYLVNMVNGFKGVLVQQMDPETGALLGERRKVYSGSGIGCTEGPRIYHIGSWYYLVVAEGGTGYSHCVTIARSDNVFGPYETMPDNPLLTSDQNDLTAIQKCGHGSFVETQNGEWYMAHLCSRPNSARGSLLGRETALQKITWQDGWPRLACGGKIAQNAVPAPKDLPEVELPAMAEQDDFDVPALAPGYATPRTPLGDCVNLTVRPGWLRLTGQESMNSLHHVTLVARRQQEHEMQAETRMDFAPVCPEQMAGFTYCYDSMNFYLLGKTCAEDGTPVLELLKSDAEYLAQLAKTLEAFDAYLWRVRDSDGDGCLETWCKYDTGEDHAMRYADAPDPWEEETPPQGCTAVPIASMDVMSYSYACRETLAEIARISGDAEAQAQWAAKAKAVQDKMVSYLWDDARGAMFDRDKNHNQMPTLIHNTLRCMYWHSLPDALAERFVKEHLLNPQEFWTKMPLPSVAADDPLFRNVTTNNWSGQAEALTYQRAIRALENYGMYELIPQLGQKLMQAIGPQCRFVQQYDPFTGEPSVICEPGQPPQDAYGPAMLSVLEYTARMYGVSLVRDTVVWGTCPLECRYTQALNGRSWEIVNSGHEAEAFVDGRKVFTAGPGLRITTDLDGNILGTARYLPDADPAQVTPQ